MSQLYWYTARAGGIVAWALLTASVIWGLWLSGRVRPLGVRPAWILDLHRFLGGLATIFVGVHVVSILLDSYTSFGFADVLVPFASSWHPVAVAWGVVALYVLLAVEITSLARRRLSPRLWRTVHVAALPLFVLATIHYVAAGTDASNPMSLVAIGAATAAVGVLVARRMSGGAGTARRQQSLRGLDPLLGNGPAQVDAESTRQSHGPAPGTPKGPGRPAGPPRTRPVPLSHPS